ncbi:type VI secretion system tip protein VgrG [Aquincola sp. S2]|uniref:Type VI secretion system tip protein VgrG n=1 Tax=Pseudaquabacterium terrae TaxID=2732868 RepID=A0ABX2ELK0_9BURK|nr:type VI secretion system Vgr family protein [Aquabacterium terrae]NRF69442.1 type VI secretion system tip protein VgrG [Aquabacterium terrae]
MDLLDPASDALAALFPHLSGTLGPHRQQHRLLRLHTPLGPDVLLAERVRIDEQIGPGPGDTAAAGLKLQIDALASDTRLELKRLLGQPVLLELLTQASRTALRPWHGHVTEASLMGSDGGFARYRLVIEPWLAFLGARRDSWVFQGVSVMEIVEQVFADYGRQGQLAPAWRWDLADAAVYPQRSLCIQYQETDLHFVQRLLREEGLFCWWEHQGDAAHPALGTHTLVIADHNGALAANAQPRVRYTQSGTVLPEDSLVRWQRRRRVHTAALTLASRDYRTLNLRDQARDGVEAGSSGLAELGLHDVPGLYAYEDGAQGERLARVQMEAIDGLREQVVARGSWRTAAPATRFTLTDHPVHDGSDGARDQFVITGVTHRARNNLAADAKAGLGILDALQRDSTQQHAAPANATDEPIYECTLTAQPARLPLRIAALDERGLPDPRLHPRPLITGVQTALVVGSGAPVHTDRDHRIKVQFHWQRGGNASHRLLSPSGADNAPASDASGTWLRVAESVAGVNWGSNFTPRLGQEVVVAFTGGDVDRPVIVGVVYNGQGQMDAQGNQLPSGAAGAAGSAPPWFPGERAEDKLQAHQHTQVHAGYKSQELSTSQGGFGGHNQLVFDDSAGEGRIELYSSSAQTRLQLGHLRHQVDNRRLQQRGHGADLATAAWGAVRAGAGMLLSAHRRPNSEQAGKQVDVREPIALIQSGQQLIHTLAESAQQHNAKAPKEPDILGAKPGERPDKAKQLPAEQGMHASLDSLETTETRGGAEGDEATIGGGAGTVPAWSRPDLVFAAPAGIGAFTPASTLLTAAATVTFAAAQDIQAIAQANHATAVKDALILYTHGKAQNATKPNQETGIALHAASGNVQTQSQTGATKIAADKGVHLASVTGKVTIAAPKHVLLWAAGAAIRMENGAISCTGPGSVLFKASQKVFNSPGGNVPHGFKRLPTPQDVQTQPLDLALHYLHSDEVPVQGAPYDVEFADGSRRKGVLDASGKALLMDVPPGAARVHYGEDARKGPLGQDEANPLFGWMD